MSLPVAVSVCEEKRGDICDGGIVRGRNPELEEVEDAEGTHKETGPPETILIVDEYCTKGKADGTTDAQKERPDGDASERAVSTREVGSRKDIRTLDLYGSSLFCSQSGVKLR